LAQKKHKKSYSRPPIFLVIPEQIHYLSNVGGNEASQQLRENSIMDELMQQIKELIDQHYAAADNSLGDLETEIDTLESNISDLRSAHDDLKSKIN